MENIQICFNAVLPLFIYIMIGVVIRRAGMINEEENKRINRMLFTFFYPVLMFDNIRSADISEIIDLKLILFAISFILLSVQIIAAVVIRIEKNDASRGAMIQAIYRSNFLLMGVMIVQNIYGKQGLPTAAMMVTFVIPCFNFIAVVLLEHFRGGKASAGSVAFKVLRNPLIIGAASGALFSVLQVPLPSVVTGVVEGISAATMPMALISLGISFDPSIISSKGRKIMICVVGRLVIVPSAGLPLAALLGFRDVAFVTLLIMMASPAAVSSYPMAVAMDSDGEIAGSAVMISTPLSCITLFLWLLIFRNLGFY